MMDLSDDEVMGHPYVKLDGAVHRAFSAFTVAELPVRDCTPTKEQAAALREKLADLVQAAQAFDVYLSDLPTR